MTALDTTPAAVIVPMHAGGKDLPGGGGEYAVITRPPKASPGTRPRRPWTTYGR
ncbi:hypothetical protein [Streptomyces sp. NPDC001315]|uniref:hypothetical protein n=1 Tax=Streptomyces sp. NPDC001315 TaxID=3364562 RepID=UPI0036742D3E